MSYACSLWEIDDGTLACYYTSSWTPNGIYYTLNTPMAGYPEGFYASERDEEMKSHNEQLQMAESSGNRAKEARGKRVDDDTSLPSQRIANAEYIEEVTSSGTRAQQRRGKKERHWEDEPWGEWVWQPEYNCYYRSRHGKSGDLEYEYDYTTPGPAF